MQCNLAREQLFDYLDQTLTPAMQQVLEHHLSECAPCKSEIEELRSMYALLDEGLPEVAVPAGFRASILSVVSEQPKPLSLAERVQQWFLPQNGRRMPAFGYGAVALLVVAAVGSAVVNRHTPASNNSVIVAPTTQGAALLPSPNPELAVQNSGIVQSIHTYQQNGQNYHVFGMHLGAKAQKTSVSSYVIRSSDALTDPTLLQDPTESTVAPLLTLTPGSSYDLPIAVPAGVASGKTMTLLSEWSDSDGLHQEISFVPLGTTDTSAPMTVSQGESLYDALASVAAAFKTPIIVTDNASSDLSKPIARGLDMSDANINDAMADLTLPAHHSFTRQNDGSYVIR